MYPHVLCACMATHVCVCAQAHICTDNLCVRACVHVCACRGSSWPGIPKPAVAPALDILIYNEPLDKLFAQGLASGIANSVTTAIVGSLLCVAYAATKTKAGSLTKE